METERMAELKTRMQKEKQHWVACVKNVNADFEVATNFYSEEHTFDNVLHKIELDLMTNLHNVLTDTIEVRIGEVKKKI